ncbi:hypothetical protein GCM10025868_24850 [Angustibacter aerolatus]|uniref:Uncharacterized protein n=1 Tax=Angustibacter aerolatus TaxID=1162965 RepID=A0ABQ6JKA8_9ACTN|nr:hypothetical protein GCM10025868_24850 [Angustibacter aerolatus]
MHAASAVGGTVEDAAGQRLADHAAGEASDAIASTRTRAGGRRPAATSSAAVSVATTPNPAPVTRVLPSARARSCWSSTAWVPDRLVAQVEVVRAGREGRDDLRRRAGERPDGADDDARGRTVQPGRLLVEGRSDDLGAGQAGGQVGQTIAVAADQHHVVTGLVQTAGDAAPRPAGRAQHPDLLVHGGSSLATTLRVITLPLMTRRVI